MSENISVSENIELRRLRHCEVNRRSAQKNAETIRAKNRLYRKQNPEKVRAWSAARQERVRAKLAPKRREAQERRTLATQQRQAERKPHRLANTRRWRSENPERMRALVRDWKKRNRDKVIEDKRRRRLVRRRKLIAYLSGLQKGRCAYCRTVLGDDVHVDHILAVARGGSNQRSNLQLTCPACNGEKSDRDALEFARARGLLI